MEAMTIINPLLCKKLAIQVEVKQEGLESIPYVHCYHNKLRKILECSCIRLDIIGYLSPKGEIYKETRLPECLKEEFVKLMSEPCGVYIKSYNGAIVELTGYQEAVKVWVDTFENGSFDRFTLDDKGIPIQLDYSSL